MDRRDVQAANRPLQPFPKLPLWIIEHVWAHKMMDIQEVLDPSYWPDVDSQPLSLEDSWRLRVVSAQVYYIVKNRDVEKFEKVMKFLESTYRLLPRLVAPIKHMKIMFGLKTMVIMWMLRQGRGMVDAVFKIIQFFPSKLPQYQDHCSQHQLFLMRKNHLDFKNLAQALVTDEVKREDYIKKHMEKNYGEQYAQKVEERLLQYLHKLETALPGDTHIDKIMKKSSPETEEEKLLLEVITRDSTAIAATLKELLHCDFASFPLIETQSHSSVGGSSLKTLPKPVKSKVPLQSQPEGFLGIEEAAQQASNDGVLENDKYSGVVGHRQTKNGTDIAEIVEGENSDKRKVEMDQRSAVHVSSSSPQFCSKHQRWVKTILQECPDDCSQQLQHQASVSTSPLLFPSSSSTSSSQDLTPSNLTPSLHNQRPSPAETSTELKTPSQITHQTNQEDEHSSGSASDTSHTEHSPQPPACSDTLLPARWSPVVRLIDIASVRTITPNLKSDHFPNFKNKQTASPSSHQVLTSPHCCTSGNKDTLLNQQEGVATTQTFSRLSRKSRRAFNTHKHLQAFNQLSGKPSADQCRKAPKNIWAGTQTSLSAKSPQQIVPENSDNPPLQTQTTNSSKTNNRQCSTAVSSVFNTNCLVIRQDNRLSPQQPTDSIIWLSSRSRQRLSLQSQAVQSTLLQPYVNLNRLSTQECYEMTRRRCSPRCVVPVLKGGNDEEEDADSSFDPNTLYSSHSSTSDNGTDNDPDYTPSIKKKRLLLEYEAARSLSHI